MSALDAGRVQRHLREGYRLAATASRIGPFTCYLHPASAHEALNVAVPDEPTLGRRVALESAQPPGEVGPADALAMLKAHFLAKARIPRIELVLDVQPGLAQTLFAEGWREEMRAPVLACTRESWRPLDAPPGVRVEALLPTTPWPLARDYLRVQRESYGLDMPIPERAPPGHWEALQIGAGILATLDGVPVAAGGLTVAVDGLCDVRGLGVVPAKRGQGIGAFLLSALARIAHETGAEAVLAVPDTRASIALAKKAGFEKAATLVSFRPEDAAAP